VQQRCGWRTEVACRFPRSDVVTEVCRSWCMSDLVSQDGKLVVRTDCSLTADPRLSTFVINDRQQMSGVGNDSRRQQHGCQLLWARDRDPTPDPSTTRTMWNSSSLWGSRPPILTCQMGSLQQQHLTVFSIYHQRTHLHGNIIRHVVSWIILRLRPSRANVSHTLPQFIRSWRIDARITLHFTLFP